MGREVGPAGEADYIRAVCGVGWGDGSSAAMGREVSVGSAPQTGVWEPYGSARVLGSVEPASRQAPPAHACLLPRDDAFSDSLSQKADSEASSGPLLDDKASSKNDLQSPTEHISDYGFGGVMGR